ncbi:hypothetical protein ACSBR1_014262 [Camellia fascicularis]
MFNLTRLRTLDLSLNSFQGTIPSEIVNLISLEYLYMYSNGNFEGQILRYLGNLCKLKFLDLSKNHFNGTIDDFLNGFLDCPNNSLVSLDLSGIFENLQLHLSSNSFWGSIPTSIGNMSSLQYFDLRFNNVNGTIPESFGKLSKLVQLDIQENPWEGVIIEVHLMNLTILEDIIIAPKTKTSLKTVWLAPNFLTAITLKNVGIVENLPEEWLSKISAQLTYLDLSNNQIEGKLPKKLESPILGFIDLSYNRFEGSLLLWSTNTSQFHLQSNFVFRIYTIKY